MVNKGEAVPKDIQVEILLRMPLKSLLKCICVSKKWASIIRGKQFKDLYLLRSMTRPRLLFGFFPGIRPSLERPTFQCDGLFRSVYQEEEPLFSCGTQHMRFVAKPVYVASRPIRGLICLQTATKIVICNPGTQKLVTLPDIQTLSVTRVKLLSLGYDELTDVFKVLCVTKMEERYGFDAPEEYYVLTMGSSEESWRPIVCTYRHTPITEGICKGGVLYYGAWTQTKEFVLMKFNLGSEEFSSFKPPKAGLHGRWNLLSYKGEIAAMVSFSDIVLFNKGEIEFWVLKEDAGQWLRIHIVIPLWIENVGLGVLSFKGTIGTGELVFAPEYFDDLDKQQLFVMYYDPVTQKFRRFEIKGMGGCQYGRVQTFLDHVDSLLLV